MLRTVTAWCLASVAAAATVDLYRFETDDAVVVEAADLYSGARGKRQLAGFGGFPQSVIPPWWPGPPAGVGSTCDTPDGRSGVCLARSSCRWTRESSEDDFNSLVRTLGACVSTDSFSPRGEPSVRGVCCPGQGAASAPATTTARPPGGTQWWQTTWSPPPSATTTTTTRRPATVPWWQQQQPAASSQRTEPAGTTLHPPYITHAWQATRGSTSRPPAAPTHPWQKPSGSTTVQSPTTTAWWATTTTTRGTTTTRRPTTTAWWATTATTKKPTTTVWWATTATTKGTTTTKRPTTTAWWATTTKSTTAAAPPASGGGGGGGPYSCGTRDPEGSDRIVGGKQAVQGEFPWLAGIFKNGRQFCGGSLIDEKHILTAAHCVAHMSSYDVSQLLIRLGDYDVSTPFEAKHETYKVARIVRHKGFSEKTLHTDIALITLSKPVKYKSNIRPICLDSGVSRGAAGQTVTVAGWGSLREGGRQASIMQKVSLKVWDNSKCRSTYGPSAPGGIISSMLCAGRQGKDSCSGDSGGPLMHISGVVYQVGVVSWGIGCGKAQYPGVYTRVSEMRDWIDRNKSSY
ncbi:transmembrane protease serine 9-like [Amphibalanus amphitrite]|uniref:transmembrane protease serine 9-like n=1 Tax=Amphibalanus amphitrite TaxID=1232801 RepID=UPI001C907D7C|nr:transmembrane protease serine 9-like [Amphibalanus amphitrite]